MQPFRLTGYQISGTLFCSNSMQPPGLILDLKKQYALPVYYLDNIETISEETIEFQINDQLFFEVLLVEILSLIHI